jgi:hypothetical protein
MVKLPPSSSIVVLILIITPQHARLTEPINDTKAAGLPTTAYASPNIRHITYYPNNI